MGVVGNYEEICRRILDAACRSDKDSGSITVVAVSKTVTIDLIREVFDCGLKVFGENRVQEAWEKYELLPEGASMHLIGRLQTNKVKRAVEIFDLIQSVDSLRLAKEISRRAAQLGKVQDVLIQVNASGEDTKAGVEPSEAVELAYEVAALDNVFVRGLMTIGPLDGDEQQIRRCFRLLKSIYDELAERPGERLEMEYLSMGMSNDFEIAVEEGANMVRIGMVFSADAREHRRYGIE